MAIEVDDPGYGFEDYTVIDVLDVVLEDDDTDHGGTAFSGETVDDFYGEAGLDLDSTIDELNEALVACGIKPITGESIGL